MYSEQIKTTTIAPIFTNTNPPTVATNAISTFRDTIIDTTLLTSTADCTVIAPIINTMLLLGNFGTPVRKYAIRSPSTLNTALIAAFANNETSVVFEGQYSTSVC